jgi:hypothetical protein
VSETYWTNSKLKCPMQRAKSIQTYGGDSFCLCATEEGTSARTPTPRNSGICTKDIIMTECINIIIYTPVLWSAILTLEQCYIYVCKGDVLLQLTFLCVWTLSSILLISKASMHVYIKPCIWTSALCNTQQHNETMVNLQMKIQHYINRNYKYNTLIGYKIQLPIRTCSHSNLIIPNTAS